MAVINSNYLSNIPLKFHGSAIPVNDPATAVTLDYIVERSWDDTVDMIKLTSTTALITATGANGTLTSGNLSGTVKITNGQNTVNRDTGTTAFLTDFQVGDAIIISGVKKVITSISSNNLLTVDSTYSSTLTGMTYQRGGNANTWYYLYVISYADGSNVALAFSTRSVASGDTLVDLPTSYTKYRQLPCVWRYLDWLGGIQRMFIENWPYQPVQKIIWDFVFTSANQQAFKGTLSTSFVQVSLATLVPKLTSVALLNFYSQNTSDVAYIIFNPTIGTRSITQALNGRLSAACHIPFFIDTSNPQISHKTASASASDINVYVTGFIITEPT
jgi:hypothetical protein